LLILILQEEYLPALQLFSKTLCNTYGFMLFLGALTLLTEWRQIRTSAVKKLSLLLGFPLFMATYIPLVVACLFKKVEWTPIRHTVAVGLHDITNAKEKRK